MNWSEVFILKVNNGFYTKTLFLKYNFLFKENDKFIKVYRYTQLWKKVSGKTIGEAVFLLVIKNVSATNCYELIKAKFAGKYFLTV